MVQRRARKWSLNKTAADSGSDNGIPMSLGYIDSRPLSPPPQPAIHSDYFSLATDAASLREARLEINKRESIREEEEGRKKRVANSTNRRFPENRLAGGAGCAGPMQNSAGFGQAGRQWGQRTRGKQPLSPGVAAADAPTTPEKRERDREFPTRCMHTFFIYRPSRFSVIAISWGDLDWEWWLS